MIRAYLERMRTSRRTWNYDRREVLARHQAVYDAITAGDPVAAAAAMQDHIDMVLRQLQARREHLDGRSPTGTGPEEATTR
ncbi:MAG: FCD domain-containing protein [Chloroflexota bacterium]